jgi:hypothetical protein
VLVVFVGIIGCELLLICQKESVLSMINFNKIFCTFELKEQGAITLSQFSSSTDVFFIDCVEYMNRWTKHDEEFKVFEWICLKKKLLWSEVEEIMKILSKYKALPEHFDDNRLFDEFTQLEEVVCM